MLTDSWWKYLGGLHSAHCIKGRWGPRRLIDLGCVRALDVFPDGRACGESLGGVPARLTVLQEWLEGRAKGEPHTGKDYRCKRGGRVQGGPLPSRLIGASCPRVMRAFVHSLTHSFPNPAKCCIKCEDGNLPSSRWMYRGVGQFVQWPRGLTDQPFLLQPLVCTRALRGVVTYDHAAI